MYFLLKHNNKQNEYLITKKIIKLIYLRVLARKKVIFIESLQIH